jgi:hypothetical protein
VLDKLSTSDRNSQFPSQESANDHLVSTNAIRLAWLTHPWQGVSSEYKLGKNPN